MAGTAGFAFCAGAISAAESSNSERLPLKEVVLYSSGTGFFERAGTVDGKETIELKFKTEDINDLLKSMVAQDFDGGSVSSVTYESRDPIAKTLKSFSVDLTENPSMGSLLNQMRGERVRVDERPASGRARTP